jgi:hypothetical protein
MAPKPAWVEEKWEGVGKERGSGRRSMITSTQSAKRKCPIAAWEGECKVHLCAQQQQEYQQQEHQQQQHQEQEQEQQQHQQEQEEQEEQQHSSNSSNSSNSSSEDTYRGEGRLDGAHPAIHHVRGGNHLRAGPGVRYCNRRQTRDGGCVVQAVIRPQQATVAVVRVRAQAQVRDDQKVGEGLQQSGRYDNKVAWGEGGGSGVTKLLMLCQMLRRVWGSVMYPGLQVSPRSHTACQHVRQSWLGVPGPPFVSNSNMLATAPCE